MSRANPRYRRNNAALPAPAGNVYRIKVLGLLESQLTISLFFYQDTLTPGTATVLHTNNCETAFTAVGGPFLSYVAALSVDWAATGLIIDSPNTPLLAPQVYGFTNPGGGPTGHEPTEVAAVITKYTAIRGQCGRGRVSLPAVPTGWVGNSRLVTLTAYNTFLATLTNQLTSGGDTFTPGIFSRAGSRTHPGAGFSATTKAVLQTLLGTVRRRKIGRGK